MKNKLTKIKKGPLSNKEKSEIKNYLAENHNAKSIAVHLNRSENIVQKHIDSKSQQVEDKFVMPKASELETIETIGEPTPERSQTSSLFARNEKYGVTIMTAQASEAGDNSRKGRVKAANTHRYSQCTTTIRKAKDD